MSARPPSDGDDSDADATDADDAGADDAGADDAGADDADLDAVDDAARDELLEHPREVSRVDAVHRRARAHHRVEAEDRVLRVLGGEALHEVDLGADREGRTRRSGLDGLDDEVGRPRCIRGIDDGRASAA